jgi:D-glycerate 3-kinase
MSLDDFYLTREKRKQLALDVHPLLATRDVPGTHDVTALDAVLTQLKEHKTGFTIPKFNKATEEPFDESEWTRIEKPADIIIVEGWCWGVKPQTETQLKTPINDLEKLHDTTGTWRTYVNQQVINAYQPLYPEMDFWLVLQAPSFDCVYQWRLEQEQKLKKRTVSLANSNVMSSAQVLDFIQYFQRLSVHGQHTLAQQTDVVFYLDNKRKITDETIII